MYNESMRTNIDLNDELVAEAMRATGARTKREVVERALAELVARSKRPSIAELLGLGGLDTTYNHKVARGGDPWFRVEEQRAAYHASPVIAVAPGEALVQRSATAKPAPAVKTQRKATNASVRKRVAK
jgi:Arc/MetJ family transcription regulator